MSNSMNKFFRKCFAPEGVVGQRVGGISSFTSLQNTRFWADFGSGEDDYVSLGIWKTSKESIQLSDWGRMS